LAIVDRAADAAVEARRGRRGLDLHGKPEVGAVSLRQMCLERIEAAPDVDDLRMVRSQNSIDNPKALGAGVR